MKFIPGKLDGIVRIELDPRGDLRGSFTRTYCQREFAESGLPTSWKQCNHTVTSKKGAIRGLHFQTDPLPEDKLIRCLRGEVWDVVVDIRPDSPTKGEWETFHLSGTTGDQIYVPEGFAHGFQCLSDDCQLFYQMSEFYDPGLAGGVRWDDPDLAIPWPLECTCLSDRDKALPFFNTLS